MSTNEHPPELVIVNAAALRNLLSYVAQAPLPMGRDQLVQAVSESVRPVAELLEPERVEE